MASNQSKQLMARSQSETGRGKLHQRHTRASTHSASILPSSAASATQQQRSSIYSSPSTPSSAANLPSSTTQIVKQLVIRARPHLAPSSDVQETPSEGLQAMMWIRVAIPHSLIPLPGSPDLIVPLMSDQRLRLVHHTIFPITRRSPSSKPTIWASNNLSQAALAASLLDLSKSFRAKNKEPLTHLPSISVVVRNFNISLLIPPSYPHPITSDHPTSPPLAMAEYVIVLDCLSLWATVGPEWPFSVILPTPPCLRNSFRLTIPTASSDALFENTKETPLSSPAVHLNTFPPLRRERMRFSNSSRNIFSAPKLSSMSRPDDLRPLSDESEPEGVLFSDEEDTQNHDPHRNWYQDELSPRFEGVFQSTREICILLGRYPPENSSNTPLTAKHASSQLSVSLNHTPTTHATNPDPAPMDFSFHVDLQRVSTQAINEKTAFVLTIPQSIAKDIISAQWSPLNGEGVIDTQLPLLVKSEQEKSPSSSPATSSSRLEARSQSSGRHRSPSKRTKTGVPMPELDLLNTAAPFLDSKSDINAETTRGDSDLDLDIDDLSSADGISLCPKKSSGPAPPDSQSTIHQFVVWLSTEWLIRRAATTHDSVNSRIVLNLRGQLEMAATSSPSIAGEAVSKRFLIPFLCLPSVEEHVCACQISTDFPFRQDLRFTLPSWASLVEQSSDEQFHQFRLSLPQDDLDPTQVIIAHLDQLDSQQRPATESAVVSDSAHDQSPSSPLARPTECFSINNLFINSASRLKYHSWRSTVSPMRKRARLHGSLRSKSNKAMSDLDNGIQPRSAFEEQPKVKPTIRSVQVDLVIDPSSDEQLVVSQYAEVSITFCRSSASSDSHINLLFPVGSNSSENLEVIGVWIGDWELTRDQGFQVLDSLAEDEDASGESTRFIPVEVDITSVGVSRKGESSSLLPILRMIVTHKNIQPSDDGGSFISLLPSVDKISVAVYKALLQASVGSKIQVKHSNMIIPESASGTIKLIRYALPADTALRPLVSLECCLSLLVEPEQASNLSDLKSRESQDEIDTRIRESEYRRSVRGSALSTSWLEQCVVRWGINWKTVLLCWLIYLVTSMNVQVDQIRGRLERMDGHGSLYEPIELRQAVGQTTEADEAVSSDAPVYPLEEGRRRKPDRPPQVIDAGTKAALLRSFMTTHDCVRRNPLVPNTKPPSPPGTTEPDHASTHASSPEQPLPGAQTAQEPLEESQIPHDHPSAEIMRDLLSFVDRFFLLVVSQPLAKLADSIGAFRRKLNFNVPPTSTSTEF
ncbi:hypothetical protein PCASD_16794 [Puccinia coronata f. sp. avenae]|uniref:Uncharacterized protein n=1 Tax=Puccinia coronata f. sp. avenae TaxID=200324 RepID=A0A2N5TVD8_9BASI|nr:hypothetical protein PCASD_16794 [Puccinia coronata f. sp. avenae]